MTENIRILLVGLAVAGALVLSGCTGTTGSNAETRSKVNDLNGERERLEPFNRRLSPGR